MASRMDDNILDGTSLEKAPIDGTKLKPRDTAMLYDPFWDEGDKECASSDSNLLIVSPLVDPSMDSPLALSPVVETPVDTLGTPPLVVTPTDTVPIDVSPAVDTLPGTTVLVKSPLDEQAALPLATCPLAQTPDADGILLAETQQDGFSVCETPHDGHILASTKQESSPVSESPKDDGTLAETKQESSPVCELPTDGHMLAETQQDRFPGEDSFMDIPNSGQPTALQADAKDIDSTYHDVSPIQSKGFINIAWADKVFNILVIII
jgi:hypothetical protein